jgi:effector-binding domain-containing protein
MDYEVAVVDVEARPTVVVAEATTWRDLPALWGQLSGEVWDCLRAGGIHRGCPNVMLYLDDVPHVEVGVLLTQPCPLTGRVVASSLPAGRVARTVHHGSFGDVGAAHEAVVGWCRAQGLRLDRTRWEVYGPHHDDPEQQQTQVFWRVAPSE